MTGTSKTAAERESLRLRALAEHYRKVDAEKAVREAIDAAVANPAAPFTPMVAAMRAALER
jgi:hypothetical protein